jgi:hypothetical protein
MGAVDWQLRQLRRKEMAIPQEDMQRIVHAFVKTNLELAAKRFQDHPTVNNWTPTLEAMLAYQQWNACPSEKLPKLLMALESLPIRIWGSTIVEIVTGKTMSDLLP